MIVWTFSVYILYCPILSLYLSCSFPKMSAFKVLEKLWKSEPNQNDNFINQYFITFIHTV